LPFLPNENFIGRESQIGALEHKLFVDGRCKKIAIVGLGGVGKTQVALQFAYSVLEKHTDMSVFWVHAMSLETFEQACRKIADVLGILGADDGTEDAKDLVHRHLSNRKVGKWMLIVDNADDMNVLGKSDGAKGILDFLPSSESGLTVFTTRDRKTAYALAGNKIIDVEKLEPTAASDLLKKMLTRDNLVYDQRIINELLDELDYLPLAITQAAAYLSCNPVSFEYYHGLLRSTERNLFSIMSEEMADLTRHEQSAHAVAKTWLVSFEQIVRQDADAADLLQYMSCIEWKAIPRSILPAIEPDCYRHTLVLLVPNYEKR
jgi:hypothetical protein